MLFSVLRAPIGRVVLSKGASISRVVPLGVATSRSFWSTTVALKEAKASTEKKSVKSSARPKVATKSAKPKAKKLVEKKNVKKTKPKKEALPKITKKDLTPPFPVPARNSWAGYVTQYLREHAKKGEKVQGQFGEALVLFNQLSDAEKAKYKASEAELAEFRQKRDAWIASMDERTRKAYRQSRKRVGAYSPSSYAFFVKERYGSAAGTTFVEKSRSLKLAWDTLSESDKEIYTARAHEAKVVARTKADEAKAQAEAVV